MSQPNTSAQRAQDTACRHAKEPFDCLFGTVAARRDLSDGAKLLHATLVSQHRTGQAWTQTQLGERIGASRQKVWRLTTELIAAGLLLVVRIGLGQPNQYHLLEIAQEDLDGSAPRFTRPAAGHQEDRTRTTSRARVPSYPKNERKNRGYTDRRCRRCSGTRAHCDRCSACLPGPHALEACYLR